MHFMHYESKTWGLSENDTAILRTEKAQITARCEIKLPEKKVAMELL